MQNISFLREPLTPGVYHERLLQQVVTQIYGERNFIQRVLFMTVLKNVENSRVLEEF